MSIRNCLLLLVLLSARYGLSQRRLTILPQFPERGQQVTVVWHPDNPELVRQNADGVQLVFTYSDLYNLPYRMKMQPQGTDWTVSFTIPPYGTYATFYLQSGDRKERPGPDSLYGLNIYHDHRLIENSYLYRAYSLPSQMGKSPNLTIKQAELFTQELEHYPENYEAQIRLLKYRIDTAATEAEKQSLLDSAHVVIGKKFLSDPGNMGVLNRVTMAYLILGENSLLDSIRQVVVNRYPQSPAGIELRAGRLGREADTDKRFELLNTLLKEQTPSNTESFADVHEQLFHLYAEKGNAALALKHARGMIGRPNPYTPVTYKDIAQTLLDHHLALDSARIYAEKALSMAHEFPLGIIRYFPETGYILPYVSDSARRAETAKARSNMLSILALISCRQGKKNQAVQEMAEALSVDRNEETLENATAFYQLSDDPEKAYGAYRDLLTVRPADDSSLLRLRQYYLRWKGSETGFPEELKTIDQIWTDRMTVKLEGSRLNRRLPLPDSLVDMEGRPVAPDQFRDRIIIIDFWATWCVPCMQEMPYMQQVFNKYGQDPRVLFLIVNSGARNTLADAQRWSGRKKYSFPVYFNRDNQIGEKLGFDLIPATYLFDSDGITQFRFVGFEGSSYEKKLDVAISLLLKDFERKNTMNSK